MLPQYHQQAIPKDTRLFCLRILVLVTRQAVMIGMGGELEYLINAWKQIEKSLQNAETV
jgi:hypothetical protein